MTAKYDAFIAELDALCKKYDVSMEYIADEYLAVCDNYSGCNIKRIQDETSEVGESLNPPSIEFKNVGNE